MEHKLAKTQEPIHELIARRWSPRAFDAETPVSRHQLFALLEAARWAPSCFGDEPWRYIVCDRAGHAKAWERALECLGEKNQGWARNAPVLIIAIADSRFSSNEKPNRWAQYDTGAASENLCLQAAALGLAAHQMGGFNVDKVRELFKVPNEYTPMAVIAVGHPSEPETLDEDFQAAERGPRERRALGECFFEGTWEHPIA